MVMSEYDVDEGTARLREELTEFINRHESPVLETVLAVAKSFDHGVLEDDEDEFCEPKRSTAREPMTFSGVGDPWYLKPLPGGRVGKLLKMGVVRAIWDDRHDCRLLIEYTVCGVTVRVAEYTRNSRGRWEAGGVEVWGIIGADLEILYLDKLERVEEVLQEQEVGP